jgi:DNA-binding NtrC family response regulator
MKSGSNDVLWTNQDPRLLKEKIAETLAQDRPRTIPHSFVSKLAETLTDKAMTQKTSLFTARKEFSKTFLTQVLSQQKLRRTQLASLMSVSPRTLHRHLSS